jgi:hypothetical protein
MSDVKIVTVKGKEYPAMVSGNSIVIVDGEEQHVLLKCGGEVALGSTRIPRVEQKFSRLEKLFPQFFPKPESDEDNGDEDKPTPKKTKKKKK